MAYLDQKPRVFQFLFGVLTVLVLAIATLNLYHYSSSPTDENWFATPPSDLYVIESFPALPAHATGAGDIDRAFIPMDSIHVGDLILFINGRSQRSIATVRKVLETIPDDTTLHMDIFRPEENRDLDFIVSKSAIPDSFIRVLQPTAYVFSVFEGGASDRAGMKEGDLILRINGEEFETIYEADQILRRAESGETLAYDVIRGNQAITLQVTIASFGVQLPVLILFICGIVFIGVGGFVGLSRPAMKPARLVGPAFTLVGFSLLSFYSRDLEVDSFTAFRDVSALFGFLFGVAIWLHSSHYFPKSRTDQPANSWQIATPYGIATLFFLLGIAGILKQGAAMFTGAAVMLLFFLVVRLIWRKQIVIEYKQLNRIIFWTLISTSLGALALQYSLALSGIQAGFIGALLVFIPLSYLYTIGRYRLLELNLEVKRNIQYTILTIIWGVGVLGLLLMLLLTMAELTFDLPNIIVTGHSLEISESPLPESRRNLFENIILMVLALGLTYVFLKIKSFGQRFIDAKYFRGRHNYQQSANEIAEVMARNLSMVELARGIVEKLAKVMHLSRAGVLFFRNQQDCCCHEAHGFSRDEWTEFCIKIERKIVDVIQRFSSEVRFSVDYLPDELRAEFQQRGFRHIIPIRGKDKLVGTLLIGGMLSESPFNQEDLSFMNAIAKQASVAIENAFLYEELAEQERLKLEFDIARRIQLASLPQTTPKLEELEIAGISIPATEVGGDYFDYLNGYPNTVTIIVGDVSGKGTSAALYLSKIQGILRSLQSFDLPPRELFIRANLLLCRDLERKSFITAIGAWFDANVRKLIVARAGHLPMYHYRSETGEVESIQPSGLGFGLDNADKFSSNLEETTVKYKPGDVFLLVTDGITEARHSDGREYGEDGLLKILTSGDGKTAGQIRDDIISSVKQFTLDTHQRDDQTVVVVKAL
jgi:serine phosphatase RsbU (regulator of sigma subunit)